MKTINILKFIIALSFLVISHQSISQLVTFSGKDSDPDDNFTIVALSEITVGTKIYFTNKIWSNTTGEFLADGEGTLVFEATAPIIVGTVTQITEPASPGNTFMVSANGTANLVGASNWSPTSADPHYAFTASNPTSPETSVTEIFAYMDTRTGVNSGISAFEDPRFGTNSSPNAIVCDWTVNQTVSLDYAANRVIATPTTFSTCTAPTYFAQSMTPIPALSLAPYFQDDIFIDGFE